MLPIFPVDGTLPPITDLLLVLVFAFAAGVVGAMLGLGGGLFIVPGLVVLFGVDIHLAIAASLVSTIATSCGSASTYVEDRLTDLRTGMFLETSTAVGGLAGALIGVTVLASQAPVLIFAFIPVVVLAAVLMVAHRPSDVNPDPPHDRLADRLALGGTYTRRSGERVPYRVTGTFGGLALVGFSGLGSGLLGIGGGLFNVPAMHSFMNVPMRVASATSIFMVGVTATAGAVVYLFAGYLSLLLVAPVAIGILAGSVAGTRLQAKASARGLRELFVGVLALAAALMFVRGMGWL
ncbi:MAG: sulfite exporter TauE/SafE family protein [Thermoplasmata archaeon]|nr:sulfite exporter TauE/SafE family protein [Thermoplasmata archaeon]